MGYKYNKVTFSLFKSALTGGVIGLVSAWFIAAQSQLAQAKGLLKFAEKPRYTYNCTYDFEPIVLSTENLSR